MTLLLVLIGILTVRADTWDALADQDIRRQAVLTGDSFWSLSRVRGVKIINQPVVAVKRVACTF